MLLRATLTLALTVALPLLGLALAGLPLEPYLRIPPEGQPREYPGFSWAAFVGIWLLFALLLGLWIGGARPASTPPPAPAARARFPAWGWVGLALCLGAWAAAWLPGTFEPLRRYSFPPLWLGFILVVNALIQRREGGCPLTREPGFFLLLFPASAAFWWLFEYLNRFVDNWVYHHAGPVGEAEYLIHASLCFSTVLPAVYSVRHWLGGRPRLSRRLAQGPRLRLPRPRLFGGGLLLLFALAMLSIGLAPEWLFPFLWIGPLGLWAGLELLARRRHPWPELADGDWRDFGGWALAALACGFFWEMWNLYALPKWTYQIPWFERFYLFEMPLSGYLGYLPFGLECALAVLVLRRLIDGRSR